MAFTMTQAQYADHRGISAPRVCTLVKQGKLNGAVRMKKGKKYIDPEKADALLEQNLSPQLPAKNKNAAKQEEKERTVAAAKLKGMDYNTAKTLTEQYKAALKKLEYEKVTGKLIPADQIEHALTNHILAAKTRLEAVQSEVVPLVREFVADPDHQAAIINAVDKSLTEAMEELSRSVI